MVCERARVFSRRVRDAFFTIEIQFRPTIAFRERLIAIVCSLSCSSVSSFPFRLYLGGFQQLQQGVLTHVFRTCFVRIFFFVFEITTLNKTSSALQATQIKAKS